MRAKISPFSSLQYRDFRLFWFGSLISEVGNQMQVVAIVWQIYLLTNSATSLGLVGVFGFIPILLFSLIGGITADKFNRKNLLIVTQIFQAILAVILFFTTNEGLITPAVIYTTIFLATASKTFQGPARQSIIPHLVPEKQFINAVSLTTLVRQSAVVIGPAIGGFLIQSYGVQSIYMLNAISFLAPIIMLLTINVETNTSERKITYSVKSLTEGIKFILSNQILYMTMFLDFLANFFASATSLLPIFAKDILQIGPGGLGLLYSAPAAGSVFAGLILASLGNIMHQGKVILLATLIFGLSTIGFGLSNNFYLSLAFLFLVGSGDIIATILRNTIRQLITPEYLRGRMVAVNMIFIQGGPLLGDAESGFLAAFIGAPSAVMFGGMATVLTTLAIAGLVPKLRKYRGHDIGI